MIRRPPRATRTDTLFPYTTLFRSHAPGFAVLEAIARQLSDDIWVCAPSEEQSGAGHSLTLSRPVRVRQHGTRRWSCTGTPTDSVMVAIGKLMPEKPDLILSGVNRGANLGDDVTYSRSEERRVGKECVSTCRYRWSPYH